MSHSSPAIDGARDKPRLQRLPPDERFWIRYSPHHELPVSGMMSLCLHGLTIGLLFCAAVVLTRAGIGNGNAMPSLGALTVEGSSDADRDGRNNSDGQATPPALREAVPAHVEHREGSRPAENREVLLPLGATKGLEVTLPKEAEGIVLRDGGDRIRQELDLVRRDAKKKQSPGQPDGAPGPDAVRQGPGKIQAEQQHKRQLRWTMMFDTRDGRDYLRQLQGLGAILAIPQADGRYLVVRDLMVPARAKVEDLGQMDRIFWIDDKPQSVQSLAAALGLKETPKHIVAFFPNELEKEMLQRELAFAGRTEDAIQETRFQVVQTPKGVAPKVISQAPTR